jgi:hypothetical protein
VHSIDISFDAVSADDFFEVVHRKFGDAHWHVEHEEMKVGNYREPHEWLEVDHVTETMKTKTRSAMMTNYDRGFTHQGGGPLYQGILEMKLLDQDL